MPFNHKKSLLFLTLLAYLAFHNQIVSAKCYENPCTNLLGIINRPTYSDSACTVPNKKILIESGYYYVNLIGGGNAQAFPSTEIRFGLPSDTEFIYIVPNYITQSVKPKTGWTATAAGVKHMVGYTDKMIFSVESYLIPPSGSRDFGSADFGTMIMIIYNYDLTDKIGLTFQGGVSSLTTPPSEGGERYNSANPDLVLAWQPTDQLQFYGEVFGQSNTGPGEGAGYDWNIGLQVLLNKNTELDVTYSQRIMGQLGGYENYVTVGLGILF